MKNEISNVILLSEKLLWSVKMQEETLEIEEKLAVLSIEELYEQLKSDNHKKVFWINCYNAYYQILAKRNPSVRKAIFKSKLILIANKSFSLDDIEHGILRKYKWKWSFGYLQNPFASKLLKSLAVDKLDFRIHFALNCGAKSCPPIAFYTLNKIETQLENAMLSFLESETTFEAEKKIIKTSKLLLWYRGDFGGTTGIKKLLLSVFGIALENYKLQFNDYSWDEHLQNYA